MLAGLLLRRSIPAMIAAFVPWLALRLTVEFLLRPHFLAPLTLRENCLNGCQVNTGIVAIPPATSGTGC